MLSHPTVGDIATSDFVIVADSKEIPVHRTILTNTSPFLNTFLTADPSCTRINANNARYDAMMIVLATMYAAGTPTAAARGGVNAFANNRYDFSVILSAWEIAMHFQLPDVAKTAASLLSPLLSRYTSVRALRSCLKHPKDASAASIRAVAATFLPPLLETEEQREEWRVLKHKYPVVVELAAKQQAAERAAAEAAAEKEAALLAKQREAEEVSARQQQQLELLQQQLLHNQSSAASASVTQSSPAQARGRSPSLSAMDPTPRGTPHQSRGHSQSQGTTKHSISQSLPQAATSSVPTSRQRALSNSLGRSEVSPVHGPSHQHDGRGVNHQHQHGWDAPAPAHQQHTRTHSNSLPHYEPLSTPAYSHSQSQPQPQQQPISYSYSLAAQSDAPHGSPPQHDARLAALSAELATLKEHYAQQQSDSLAERRRLHGLLESVATSDSDAVALTREVAAMAADTARVEAETQRLIAEAAAYEQTVSDNAAYCKNATVYVPAAHEAAAVLGRHFDDAARLMSRGGDLAAVRDMLKQLLINLREEKTATAAELQQAQQAGQGLRRHIDAEREKAHSITEQLMALRAAQ